MLLSLESPVLYLHVWIGTVRVSHLPHPKKVNLHNHEQAEVIEASIPKSEVTAHDRLQVLREITWGNIQSVVTASYQTEHCFWSAIPKRI